MTFNGIRHLCWVVVLCSACGDRGEEISTRQPDLLIDVSGNATLIGATATADGNLGEQALDIWLGSVEEMALIGPGHVTFYAPQGTLNLASGECETADVISATCPFQTTANIGMGLGLFARVEDPRGVEGNWLTTISPVMVPDEINSLRENPEAAVLTQSPFVFSRDVFLSLLTDAVDKSAEEVEAAGIGLYLISQINADGSISPSEGTTFGHSSSRSYQIIYSDDVGLPDPNLQATTSSGLVWILPAEDYGTLNALGPILTLADGRRIASQAFIMPRFTVSVMGALVSAGD